MNDELDAAAITAAWATIGRFIERELMPHPYERMVWDLGCGDGEFSAALTAFGATVLGSDLVIHSDRVPDGITFVEGGFDAVAARLGGTLDPIDMVFMHLVTEHVVHLRDFFVDLFDRLRPGVEVFVHHDNYFQPLGHHDHGLLALDAEQGRIAARGPVCWSSSERCAASATHRAELAQSLPWLWSDASEATKDPDDCGSCNYYRRSQPWAQLICGEQLRATFPEPWFRTQLNRVTPSQVMWDAQDAGFVILRAERSWVMNEAPDHLVRVYGRETLNAMSLTLRLARP